MVSFKSLREMLDSEEWQAFESDKLGNSLYLEDPERADRIQEAAGGGCDGSTHGEHIDDWREFLGCLSIIDPDWPDRAR